MQLGGKLAVVTGGGSGIGRALALALAHAGCDVAVADIELDAAEAVAAEVAATGHKGVAVRVDVTDDADVAALADTVGPADVVCANAGVLLHAPIAELNDQDWRWLFDVNVLGVVRTVNAFLPGLRAKGAGHLVITSSVTAIAGAGAYGASKAALLHLAESLHEELAPDGIGVTTLLPSHVNSRINSAQRNRPETLGRKVPEPYAAVTEFGIDAAHVGRLAVEAVERGDLYVAVAPDGQQHRYTQPLKARLEAMQAAAEVGRVRP
jgi:NAD(P)-dependent dehydrogenase (short-subunit alcohol dehydrogenase family)